MQMAILAMLCGVLLVQHSDTLPNPLVLGALAVLATALRIAGCPRHRPAQALLGVAIALVAGMLYTTLRAQARVDDLLAPALDTQTLALTGQVVGLPQRSGAGVRFGFRPEPASVPLPAQLAVSWYPARGDAQPVPAFGPGQRLTLTLRLRRHHSNFNPGGFDYAGWQFARGVGGGAYVRGGALVPGGTRGPGERIDAVRDRIRARIATLLDPPTAALVTAMAVGDQGGIDAAQWHILRATGTAHLVAISGLHVSIVAGLAGVLAGGLWRRIPALALRLPAQRAAICAAALAALAYATLAGFGVPVTRAVLMVLIASAALLCARRLPARHVLVLALGGVVIYDPWAVLAAGFWLSFGAVAALVLVLAGRREAPSRVGGLVRAQWGISLVTAPLLLSLFGAVSLVAPLANLVAIPLVTVAVVPWVLGGVLSGTDGPILLAGAVLAQAMDVLEIAAGWSWASWSHGEAPQVLVALAVAGGVWLLLPHATPLRILGALAMVPMLLWVPARPPVGHFEATVIDVGQGLAVHVRTHHHDLLYDTGRTYYRGGDAGERIVVPYLRATATRQLDMLVLSHGDNDHVGGAISVVGALPVVRRVAGEGVDGAGLALDGQCAAGTTWTWSGVAFAWLHPPAGARLTRDNNRSCVLHVRGAGGSLLLPGDIESGIEATLVSAGAVPSSTVVVAPHHGSKSSSSRSFIAAVGASQVVFASGRGNPFGHPVEAVVARWAASGARTWRTDRDGAVHFSFDADRVRAAALAPVRRRYWHGVP